MTRRPEGLALLLLLAGCGGGGEEKAEPAETQSDLDNAAALAAEAAADEAADINLYGGNAAAGEVGNTR